MTWLKLTLRMRITRKQTIANIPVLEIRDYFDFVMRHNSANFTAESFREYLNLNDLETNEAIKELLDKDFVERVENNYEITLKGSALRIARCVTPINKLKADKLLRDFIQRVQEINNDDYYLYRVSKILLFGSYIREDATDYADIDIAFELEKKITDQNKFLKLSLMLVDEAKDKGKSFSSFFEEICYARSLVLLKLKNRNRYISLHEMDDEILEITETKQIYPLVDIIV